MRVEFSEIKRNIPYITSRSGLEAISSDDDLPDPNSWYQLISNSVCSRRFYNHNQFSYAIMIKALRGDFCVEHRA